MTYQTIVEIASDQWMLDRCIAAAAEQGERDARVWAQDNIWHLAAAPGWADAWDYAKASGDATPGGNRACITDAMILSAVQARQAELAAP